MPKDKTDIVNLTNTTELFDLFHFVPKINPN